MGKRLGKDKAFYGQNPPNGAMINFYLKEPLGDKESVAITIQDSKGATVRTINCTRLNPQAPQIPQGIPGGGGGGFGGFGGGAQQCNVVKGNFSGVS